MSARILTSLPWSCKWSPCKLISLTFTALGLLMTNRRPAEISQLQLLTLASPKHEHSLHLVTSTHVEKLWHHAIDNEWSLKMATWTESSPPPLFCSQSAQVSQQWPQPTFGAWYGWSGCVYPEHGSWNNLRVFSLKRNCAVECHFI